MTGTITTHLEYGAPNFGEDPAHDAHELDWYLDLSKPICVAGKNDTSPESEAERGIRRLQIVFLRGQPSGAGWIGHGASVTGTLFHAISGHHHTKVLITAEHMARQ